MQAEREAISRALERFRWNRRKVAEYSERQLQDAAEQDEGVRDHGVAWIVSNP